MQTPKRPDYGKEILRDFRDYIVDILKTETVQQDMELLDTVLNETVNLFPTQETIIAWFGPEDDDGVEIYLAHREDVDYLNLWFDGRDWRLERYKSHHEQDPHTKLTGLEPIVDDLISYMWGES